MQSFALMTTVRLEERQLLLSTRFFLHGRAVVISSMTLSLSASV